MRGIELHETMKRSHKKILGISIFILALTMLSYLYSGKFWIKPETDKIQNAVLTLTGLVIFWYSWETWWLKEYTFENLRLQIRPLFVPIAVRQTSGKINLYIKNLSKGEASNFQWWVIASDGSVQKYGIFPRAWPISELLLSEFQDQQEFECAKLVIQYYWNWGAKDEPESREFNLGPLRIEGSNRKSVPQDFSSSTQ